MHNKSIYTMTDTELYKFCVERGLTEEECHIIHCYIYEKLKGEDFYEAIGYSKNTACKKRKSALDKLLG